MAGKGRADFTFSKSHRLEEVTVHIPSFKMEQQVALYNLSQTMKKKLKLFRLITVTASYLGYR